MPSSSLVAYRCRAASSMSTMRAATSSAGSQATALSSRPWGIVVAPSSFGPFSNDLLIGNFGNGEILAYDSTSDMFLGTLNGANGQPLVNDHLWALETRNGVNGFDPNAVYFAAGINDEADGLFGQINANTPEPASIIGTATGLLALAFARARRFLPGRSRLN